MKKKLAIVWFRQDLRLHDHPALFHASEHYDILPIYILDHVNAKDHAIGGASAWWLHHSLTSLNQSIDNHLSVYLGDAETVFEDILSRMDVDAIYWNRCYEPWRMDRDTKIKANLQKKGLDIKTYQASLLWEPWQVKKADGTHYKVFTPFYRKGCLNASTPRQPFPKPKSLSWIKDPKSIDISALKLLPKKNWSDMLSPHWHIGEEGAMTRLENFIDEGLEFYKEGRNTPAKPFVSRLSPHLHLGEISPNQIWYALKSLEDNENIDHFCSELGWREFSYSQLYHQPDLPWKNLQSKFDRFPWKENPDHLKAWKNGMTGIPMVDAGMRELWQTGFMHNRVRMITGSFLVKNLLLHWHHGERWFWDTLVDADLANNSASWQWIAGCGADAAPYFRIFNPVTQGQKFDPDGTYIRQYIPEIAKLPNKYLFSPWEAPDSILKSCGIELGVTYPKPIVDLKSSRQSALNAFQALKTKSE